MDKKLLSAAIRYGKQGIPVFPVDLTSKRPVWSNADLGLGPGQGGFKMASRRPDIIRKLCERGNAIAMPTGKESGIVVIDVDLYKGEDSLVGEWHEAHKERLGRTRWHETQSGGRHYLFAHNSAIRYPGKLHPAVEVKANGGYVLMPPSKGYTVGSRRQVGELTAQALGSMRVPTLSGQHGAIMGEYDGTYSDHDLAVIICRGIDYHAPLLELTKRWVRSQWPREEIEEKLAAIHKVARQSPMSEKRRRELDTRFGSELARMIDGAEEKFAFSYEVDNLPAPHVFFTGAAK